MPTRPKNRAAWENRDPEDHFVYIMGHLDANNTVTGPSKVGISKHPIYRLKQVQAQENGKIVLVAQFGFWKRAHAERVEKGFHKVSDAHRIRGEWFDIEPMHAVGLMSVNLQAFAADFLGGDETSDFFSAYSYLNVPGSLFDIDLESFEYNQ